MHSSLAKDAAETGDGVGKSLTAAAVVREHGRTGAWALVGIECRPVTISTASGGSGREVASDQREPRTRSLQPIRDGRRA
eukprot:7289127-Prymnesium_polylepis.1